MPTKILFAALLAQSFAITPRRRAMKRVDVPKASKIKKELAAYATRSQVTLVMTLVERAAGAPLGLYTACLATTLYLMLPMFNGADVVFRNVLVPLAGQREALLLKDAKTLAKNMVKQLPASRHGEAGEAIAEAFLVEAKMQK